MEQLPHYARVTQREHLLVAKLIYFIDAIPILSIAQNDPEF
jgi:hypothetical protein